MKSRDQERYPIESSPFFKCPRQSDLARTLGLSKKDLHNLVRWREYNYRDWVDDVNGKRRRIAVPVGDLRRVHERIQKLLGRVILPEYVFSPRKGKKQPDNAAFHADAKAFFQLDIKQFYPSTTREHVFRFCKYRLGMSDDVSGQFAKLTTFEGRLPFGSPLSPILCVLVHMDMFDEIASLCTTKTCKLSVWVDDLTISGASIDGELIAGVKAAIRRKGFRYHKVKKSRSEYGVEITGIFMRNGDCVPKAAFHRKLALRRAEYDAETCPAKKMSILHSLIGMNRHAHLISTQESPVAIRAAKRLQWLDGERRRLEALLSRLQPEREEPLFIPASQDVPW
ncbi:reverse transcriptase family protein [Salinarimonas sp.]|uniref:reverse transcriptase family protein n=1 Tax=Salinarimonas sp. TaxID=2766526 RepID=UPI0032D988D0